MRPRTMVPMRRQLLVLGLAIPALTLGFRIDVGTERRTIVAGIAEAYEPEALVGKTVVIVANLKPAKLMGIESNGMVLAASPDGGHPIVLDASPAAPGTRVR